MASRPRPRDTLYEVIEQAREGGRLFTLLSEGIHACIQNGGSLLEDFLVLVSANRFPAAQFMYTTAMEEMGKALILFDMARVNWQQHDSLRKLCSAFYSHLKKFGYARTLKSPGAGSLSSALNLYKLELVEYWPNNNPEDGSPDELAAALVNREWAIYVDWSDYDRRWFELSSSSLARFYGQKGIFGEETVGAREITGVLEPLRKADVEGIFTPEALEVVHDRFAPHYINVRCEYSVEQALTSLQAKLARQGISISGETLASNFLRLPLYAVILAPDQIPAS